MNEDGSLGIPHGSPSEEEIPSAAPIIPGATEEISDTSVSVSGDNELNISHDSPDEEQTVPVNSEPIDIFANPNSNMPADATPNDMLENPNNDTPSAPGHTHLSNNPFNSRSRYQSSSSRPNSGSGVPQFFNDAIISNTPVKAPRNSKKGILIGVGIAAAIVGIIAAVILLPNIGTSGGDGSIAGRIKDSTKQLFYSYGNYLLFGIDSNAKIDTNNLSTTEYSYLYKINTAAGIYDQDYANTLSEKFAAFADKAKNDYNNEESQIIDIINEYTEVLDFIKSNPTREELSLDALYKEFLTNGKVGAEQRANNQLAFYNVDNDTFRPFYEAKQNSYTSFIKYLDILKTNGCIVNGEINTSCETSIKKSKIDKDSSPESAANYNDEANNLVDREVHNLASDYLSILAILDEKR